MQTLVNKIDKIAKDLDALRPINPEYQQLLDKKFRLEFNYNSNHLEGNTLTYNETELLLIFDDTKGSHTLREYEEMKAHDVAYKLVYEWAKDMEHPLNETLIKNLNEIILVRPFWKDAITPDGQSTRRKIKVGEYKEFPNSVRLQNGELFEYASPSDTPILMGELIQWHKNEVEKNELHPVALAALFHYKFVTIHPFDDGNGRISRLLMNYILIKNNLPPIVIKSIDKRNYLSALNSADTGDLDSFIKYIAQQLIWSLELSIKAAKGENIEEPDDVEKEIAVWKKQFNKQSSGVLPKTELQVHELYKNGLRNLFELYLAKVKQFDDMFAFREITGWVNDSTIRDENTAINYIDTIFDNWGNSQVQPANAGKRLFIKDNRPLENIALKFHHKGFIKDGTNTFNVLNELRIDFLPFVYQIKFENEVIKENLYSDFLTDDNAQSIARHCIKRTFEQIKSQVKNK
jgi:Fic family protein